jgi:hypothetical protein
MVGRADQVSQVIDPDSGIDKIASWTNAGIASRCQLMASLNAHQEPAESKEWLK